MMLSSILFLVAAALLPPLVLLRVVYQMDKLDREPGALLLALFFRGALAMVPSLVLEVVADQFIDFFPWRPIVYLTSGFSTAVVRAIFSIPGHAMFGVVMGEAMSRAKWLEVHGQREQAGAARRRAWLLPAVLHGLYDFLLVGFGWIFYGYFAGLVVYVVRLLRQSAREDGPINL